MTARRLPRFKRGETEPFVVTPRDVEIIRLVHRHRFLRSDQIIRLVGPGHSGKKILERLKLLFHNQYLDRPREQILFRTGGGSAKHVYGLGDRGGETLSTHDGLQRVRRRWSDKNREAGTRFIKHTLMVADFVVSLTEEVRKLPGVRLISREEIVAAASDQQRRRLNPDAWEMSVRRDGMYERVGLVPDQIFGLEFANLPSDRNRYFYFLEVDRGTMVIERSRPNPRQTSFMEKMAAYEATRQAWRNDPQAAPFRFSDFRVLALTTSPARIESMIAAGRKLSEGRGLSMMFFLTHELLVAKGALSVFWTNGRGQTVLLVPKSYIESFTSPHQSAAASG